RWGGARRAAARRGWTRRWRRGVSWRVCFGFVPGGDPGGERARLAVADGASVDPGHRRDAAQRPGRERLGGGVRFGESEVELADRDPVGAGKLEHVTARDALEVVAP